MRFAWTLGRIFTAPRHARRWIAEYRCARYWMRQFDGPLPVVVVE